MNTQAASPTCEFCGDLDAVLYARGHLPAVRPFCTKCGRRLTARESEHVEPLRVALGARAPSARLPAGYKRPGEPS